MAIADYNKDSAKTSDDVLTLEEMEVISEKVKAVFEVATLVFDLGFVKDFCRFAQWKRNGGAAGDCNINGKSTTVLELDINTLSPRSVRIIKRLIELGEMQEYKRPNKSELSNKSIYYIVEKSALSRLLKAVHIAFKKARNDIEPDYPLISSAVKISSGYRSFEAIEGIDNQANILKSLMVTYNRWLIDNNEIPIDFGSNDLQRSDIFNRFKSNVTFGNRLNTIWTRSDAIFLKHLTREFWNAMKYSLQKVAMGNSGQQNPEKGFIYNELWYNLVIKID